MCQLPNRGVAGVPAARATSTAAPASATSATPVNASAAFQAPRAPVGSTLRWSSQRRRLRAALSTISPTAAAASTKSRYGGRTRKVATKMSAATAMAPSSSSTDRSRIGLQHTCAARPGATVRTFAVTGAPSMPQATWDDMAAGRGCAFDLPRADVTAQWELVGKLTASSWYLPANQMYRGHGV